MKQLRVGTRGSDLALWQTEWVSRHLRAAYPALEIDRIIITTHGDTAVDQPFSADWPTGGFVGAIEQALVAGRIDFAVHSFKDLPTARTGGLTIAAVPKREVVHDVLFTRERVALDSLPPGFKIATSSPRRAAQLRRLGNVQIVPIRGNVPTRLKKLDCGEFDGVVLAAAGVTRLELSGPHRIDLPVERFVPSPAQGALAVQSREEPEAIEILRAIEDADSHRRVTAERAFLKEIGAGCHIPVGALATLNGPSISLHGQLFSDDGSQSAEATESGTDPEPLGRQLAQRLKHELMH